MSADPLLRKILGQSQNDSLLPSRHRYVCVGKGTRTLLMSRPVRQDQSTTHVGPQVSRYRFSSGKFVSLCDSTECVSFHEVTAGFTKTICSTVD
jgi:hypothetical protein